MNNNHYTIVKNGLYTLKSKNEIITGRSYLDCLEQLIKKHPFLNEAKGIVVSANVMMKKPEIGIYHFLLSQYRILPHESLFIDDMEGKIN